jgi:hypothetical protein
VAGLIVSIGRPRIPLFFRKGESGHQFQPVWPSIAPVVLTSASPTNPVASQAPRPARDGSETHIHGNMGPGKHNLIPLSRAICTVTITSAAGHTAHDHAVTSVW